MEIARSMRLLAWLSDEFQWPPWASEACILLVTCLVSLHLIGRISSSISGGRSKSATDDTPSEAYYRFRRQYLVVYFLVMFADWLQGTHMYSLYESYGLDVSVLFLTGFLSSALFGGVVGPLVDRHGRRKACLVFCVLEITINVMENFPSMAILLAGRVLGGISTSILFSAFECWMVTEHRARGFKEEWIAKTFAVASEGNGLLAVLAGVVAQFAADAMGEIGPFRLAVGVTVFAMVFIFQWEENYGTSETTTRSDKDESARSSWTGEVWALGLCYSLFEGAMYVFVFLWYPTLYAVVPGSVLPSGLVFSSFMLCIAIGGKLYDSVGDSVGDEALAVGLCALSSIALMVPNVTTDYLTILVGFLVFEVCVGAFSPCSGTLRSRYFPTEGLSTNLGVFRLPTNVLVVLGTGGSTFVTRETLFVFCSGTMVAAAALGFILFVRRSRAKEKRS